jgi:hypothetical protein
VASFERLSKLVSEAETPEEARAALTPFLDRVELKFEVEARGTHQSKGRWISGAIHFKNTLGALSPLGVWVEDRNNNERSSEDRLGE